MDDVSSIRDLINLWPRRADLAADIAGRAPWLRISTQAVHKWAENGSIPARYHHAVLESAGARGFPVTADLIVRLHARPPEGHAA